MSETKIIAFEGIDGTGKSVQMEALRTRLEARGRRVGVLSFPDYGSFFGGCVGRYLTKKDGVSASDVDQRSMALWFAMDRWAAFQGFDYSKFDVLVINRYVLSNAVYQSIRDRDVDKPDILDFVLTLEHEQLSLPPTGPVPHPGRRSVRRPEQRDQEGLPGLRGGREGRVRKAGFHPDPGPGKVPVLRGAA